MRIKKETLKDIQFGVMSVFAGAFAFVWWSVLYPELCFPDDTYEVVYEDADMAESGGADRMKQNSAEDWEMLSEEEIFERLLQAEEEQVIVKSRLLEWLRQQAD